MYIRVAIFKQCSRINVRDQSKTILGWCVCERGVGGGAVCVSTCNFRSLDIVALLRRSKQNCKGKWRWGRGGGREEREIFFKIYIAPLPA